LGLLGVSPLLAQTQTTPIASATMDIVPAIKSEAAKVSEFYDLGNKYFQGTKDTPKDIAQALSYYELAAQDGHVDAAFMAASIAKSRALNGELREKERAHYWFERAAIAGYAPAQAKLGLMALEETDQTNKVQSQFWLERAAKQGHTLSQYQLALIYDQGLVGEPDPIKARPLYEMAAMGGYAPAQHVLGLRYDEGEGVNKDPHTAFIWYDRAAKQGYLPASFDLGQLYETGNGVLKDMPKAISIYEAAATQGHGPSQARLGLLYSEGLSVPQDDDKAYYWLDRAARLGEAEAMFDLASLLESSETRTKDLKSASYWYQKSAENGFAPAIESNGPNLIRMARALSKMTKNPMLGIWPLPKMETSEGQAALSIILMDGNGIETDRIEAYKWMLLATAQNADHAANLKHMEARLTQEEIFEAKKRARDFVSG